MFLFQGLQNVLNIERFNWNDSNSIVISFGLQLRKVSDQLLSDRHYCLQPPTTMYNA